MLVPIHCFQSSPLNSKMLTKTCLRSSIKKEVGTVLSVGNGKSQVPSIAEPKMSFTRFTVQNAQGGWAT